MRFAQIAWERATFRRAIAFAPCALTGFLIMVYQTPAAPSAESPPTYSDMESFIACPLSGLHKNGKPPVGRELKINLLKNRYLSPITFDPTITIARMAQPGDDRNRWNQNKSIGARITGYVAFIIQNFQGENCNCNKLDDAHSDTHIDLITNEKDSSDFSKHVIIEVTPRIKYLARKRGEDWSTNGLAKQFYHKWVNVQGWLLWDEGHEKHARNTNPEHLDKVWRATCWEVHPVTTIKVSSAAAPAPPHSLQGHS